MPVAVEPAAVDGIWFRHVRAGLAPSPSRTRRHPAPPARWQRGEVVDALYLADSEETAWAEWYRHLAEAGIPPNEALPRELWRWDVHVVVADLSTPALLERAGLPEPRPGRATWPAFQAMGEALWREGWAGLVAPSAARPEGRALCLFLEAGRPPDGVRPAGRGRLVREPPVPPTGMTT